MLTFKNILDSDEKNYFKVYNVLKNEIKNCGKKEFYEQMYIVMITTIKCILHNFDCNIMIGKKNIYNQKMVIIYKNNSEKY